MDFLVPHVWDKPNSSDRWLLQLNVIPYRPQNSTRAKMCYHFDELHEIRYFLCETAELVQHLHQRLRWGFELLPKVYLFGAHLVILLL